MTSVLNPFSEATLSWSPSSAAGATQKSSLHKYAAANMTPVSNAVVFTLDNKCVTDFVVTAQCLHTDGSYFRCDMRGAWRKEDGTITVKDAAAVSGNASANTAGYAAVLDLSGSDVRVKLTGTGQWSIAVNRLITAKTPFDPLSYGTCKLWIDASRGVTAPGGVVTGVVDQSANGALITPTVNADAPGYQTANAAYADKATIDFLTGAPALHISGHGLGASAAFTVIVVGKGGANFWMQDANGGSVMSAGGGSGNKLQISCDAATYLVGATTASSGVAGVYAGVFDGTATSKVHPTKLTAEGSGSAGTKQTLTNVQITIGNADTPSSGSKMDGSIRHFLIYSGALSAQDVSDIMQGFATESGLTVS